MIIIIIINVAKGAGMRAGIEPSLDEAFFGWDFVAFGVLQNCLARIVG